MLSVAAGWLSFRNKSEKWNESGTRLPPLLDVGHRASNPLGSTACLHTDTLVPHPFDLLDSRLMEGAPMVSPIPGRCHV